MEVLDLHDKIDFMPQNYQVAETVPLNENVDSGNTLSKNYFQLNEKIS